MLGATIVEGAAELDGNDDVTAVEGEAISCGVEDEDSGATAPAGDNREYTFHNAHLFLIPHNHCLVLIVLL